MTLPKMTGAAGSSVSSFVSSFVVVSIVVSSVSVTVSSSVSIQPAKQEKTIIIAKVTDKAWEFI